MRMLRFVCAVIGIAICSACVADKQYRVNQSVFREELTTRQFDPTESEDPQILDMPSRYRLAFIEFNDRGVMFDRRQLDRALEEIAETKREAAARRSAPGGSPDSKAIVAVFVHGWKNNASDSSGNTWGFRQVLAGLSHQYDAPVVGVYIGWRGAIVSAPILKEFTFFDRHRQSQKVTTADMPGVFRSLMQAAKGPMYDDTSTLSIFIGHSFGGAVLEDTVSSGLAEEVLTARRERRRVRWPADLILLLNEAQEAERSYPLIDTMIENVKPRAACTKPGGIADNERPAVMSISSTADQATRAFFPGAQVPARLFHRPSYKGPDPLGVGSATPLFFSTTAHTAAFRSHLIGRAEDPAIAEATKRCIPYLDFTLSTPGGADIRYLMVERPEPAKNHSPYWVMHMPPSIVPDHSTIFTQLFRDFLISLAAPVMFNKPHDQTVDMP
jgi:hypothetical protein